MNADDHEEVVRLHEELVRLRNLILAILFGWIVFGWLLAGCVSTQLYTYRNPSTGAQAQCQKTVPGIVAGGFWPGDKERILHAFAQECVDELATKGYTERVW